MSADIMESLSLSFGIVMPMLVMMLLGQRLNRFVAVDTTGFDVLNTLCFKLLLPAALFQNIYAGGTLGLNSGRMIIWAVICHLLILLLLILIVPRFFEKNPVCASIIQACFRSNFITFGLGIAARFCDSNNLAVVSVLAGIMIPLYNVGGVAILEFFRGGRPSPGEMLKSVTKNPFVISCAVALLVKSTGINLPGFAETAVKSTAACAAPISFIALGGGLKIQSISVYKKEIAFGVAWRLIIQPAVFLTVSLILGFRGIEFLALSVMLISPTAVATYPMARSMGADGDLAGHLVIMQSLAAMPTIFIWISLLNGAGLI